MAIKVEVVAAAAVMPLKSVLTCSYIRLYKQTRPMKKFLCVYYFIYTSIQNVAIQLSFVKISEVYLIKKKKVFTIFFISALPSLMTLPPIKVESPNPNAV